MTSKAGVADGRWSTGAAFGDYDGDGYADLMVTNYVDFKLGDLPGFGSSTACKYRGIDVQLLIGQASSWRAPKAIDWRWNAQSQWSPAA